MKVNALVGIFPSRTHGSLLGLILSIIFLHFLLKSDKNRRSKNTAFSSAVRMANSYKFALYVFLSAEQCRAADGTAGSAQKCAFLVKTK